jgi:hypothetical protein
VWFLEFVLQLGITTSIHQLGNKKYFFFEIAELHISRVRCNTEGFGLSFLTVFFFLEFVCMDWCYIRFKLFFGIIIVFSSRLNPADFLLRIFRESHRKDGRNTSFGKKKRLWKSFR